MAAPYRVLLVEDNPGDVRLAKEAISESGVNAEVLVAKDGFEALAMLRRDSEFHALATPHIVLLDLNMPRMDGRELLSIIKEDANLRIIPVVVLSTSQSDEDIRKSYELYANCYVKKPVDLYEFIRVIKYIGEFWLGVATLPGGDDVREY